MPEQVRSAAAQAIRIRAFETALIEEFGRGAIRGTVHTSIGQELTPALLPQYLVPQDMIFGTHRSHAYFLSLTNDFESLAREIMGRQGGCSLGLGGSQHLVGEQILTNGIQGGFVPIAGGFSLDQEVGIGIAIIGDGSLGQGILYETLNLAAVLSMPLLVLLEDNEIAQSTPSRSVFRGEIKSRVEGFGLKFFEAQDSEPLSLDLTIGEAVRFVRTSRSPAFLKVRTQRLGPHSKGDDNRSASSLDKLRDRDPLVGLQKNGEIPGHFYEEALTEMRGLFAKVRILPASEASYDPDFWRASVFSRCVAEIEGNPNESIRAQISSSLAHSLASDPLVAIYGEDIESLPEGMSKPYPGAFGVTGNLSEKFPGRVNNTPISEQAIAGMGIGRALSGRPTILEIMFGDFTTLILDQIRQQATKITWMYGREIFLPLVIRTSSGGRKGYGPTHSQSLEGVFLGISNLNVFSVSGFGAPRDLFLRLLATGFPTIVFEDKDLYVEQPLTKIHPGYERASRFGVLGVQALSPLGRKPKLTILTYGNAANLVAASLFSMATNHELFADVLVYQFLSPFDINPLLESASQTGKLLIVEEGEAASGIASSVLSALSDLKNSPHLQIQSVSGHAEIGANNFSENAAKISVEKILHAAVRITTEERF